MAETVPTSSATADTTRQLVQKTYIAYFGRPADPEGLSYWSERIENEGLSQLIEAFANAEESVEIFAVSETAEQRVNTIYQQLYNRSPEAEGLAFYVGRIESGAMTPASAMLDILSGAQNADLDIIEKKLAAAESYTAFVAQERLAYAGNGAAEVARGLLVHVQPGTDIEAFKGTVDRAAQVADYATQRPPAFATLVPDWCGFAHLLESLPEGGDVEDLLLFTQQLVVAGADDPQGLQNLIDDHGGSYALMLANLDLDYADDAVMAAAGEGGIDGLAEFFAAAVATTPATPPLPFPILHFNAIPVLVDVTLGVDEDAGNSVNVGAPVTGTDADADPLAYSIISGNTAGVFAIHAITGQISVADNTSLDYATTAQYTLTVLANDGLASDTATVTIEVLEIEAPISLSLPFSAVPTITSVLTVAQTGNTGKDTISANVYTATSIHDLSVTQVGGDGDDTLALDLTAASFHANSIDILGGPGSDAISAQYLLTGAGVDLEAITLDGGDSDDTLALAFDLAGTAYPADFSHNAIALLGDAGDDLISFDWNMTGILFSANFTGSLVALDGGLGDDTLALDWNHGLQTGAAISGMAHELVGDGGDDSLSLEWLLQANTLSPATANSLTMSGGTGNDSLHMDLQFSDLSHSFFSNDLTLLGGASDDTLTLDWSLKAGTYVSNAGSAASNSILMEGAAGDDGINFIWQATDFTVNGAGTGTFSGNDVTLSGGDGIDTISLAMNMFNAVSNSLFIDGGNGADSLDVDLVGYFDNNIVTLHGGAGDDDIDMLYSNTATSGWENWGETVTIDGDGGDDSLAFAWQIVANTQSSVTGMDVSMSGGTGSDTLFMALQFSDLSESFFSNDLTLLGGAGDDTLTLDWSLNLGDRVSSAGSASSNQVLLDGGSGNDAINFMFQATDTTTLGARTGLFSGNEITINGGDGADSISVGLDAADFHNNVLKIAAGAGVDSIDIGMDISSPSGNAFVLNAGAGADTISNSGSTTSASFLFQYLAMSDLGDAINGFGTGSNISFEFDNTVFNGDADQDGIMDAGNFALANAAADADDFWFYAATDNKLYYDADATGTGTAVVVATFDTTMSFTANQINFIPTVTF